MTAMSRSPEGGPGEGRVSRAIPRLSAAGTCIAVARRAVLAVLRAAPALPLVAGGPLMGCITQDLHFVPPENFPPSVGVPEGGARPLDAVVRLTADQLSGGGDAGPLNFLRFDVEVRDPDVDQELQYLLFIDYQRGVTTLPNGAGFVPAVAQGASDRRSRVFPLQVPVVSSVLREPGCHRVELLVSERFRVVDGVQTREPLTEGDLGTGVWWVATQATEGDAVDMTGCP